MIRFLICLALAIAVSAPAWAGCDTNTIDGMKFKGHYSGKLAGKSGPHNCRNGKQIPGYYVPAFTIKCTVRGTSQTTTLGNIGGFGGHFSFQSGSCRLRQADYWWVNSQNKRLKYGKYTKSSKKLYLELSGGVLNLGKQ